MAADNANEDTGYGYILLINGHWAFAIDSEDDSTMIDVFDGGWATPQEAKQALIRYMDDEGIPYTKPC